MRAEPLKATAELAMNPDPFTVSAKALPPAVVEEGEIVLIVGDGFGGGLFVVTLFDPPPPHPTAPAITKVCNRTNGETRCIDRIRIRFQENILGPMRHLPNDLFVLCDFRIVMDPGKAT